MNMLLCLTYKIFYLSFPALIFLSFPGSNWSCSLTAVAVVYRLQTQYCWLTRPSFQCISEESKPAWTWSWSLTHLLIVPRLRISGTATLLPPIRFHDMHVDIVTLAVNAVGKTVHCRRHGKIFLLNMIYVDHTHHAFLLENIRICSRNFRLWKQNLSLLL